MSEGKEVPEEVKMLLALTPQELRVIFAVRKEQALKTLPPNSLEQPATIIDSTFNGPDSDISYRVYTPIGECPNIY
jgi:hypothetical protein